MILKSDVKFEEKTICFFKNDKNLLILIRALKVSNNLHFDWSISCKVTFDIKSTVELSFMTLNSHAKFEEKLTYASKNDMRNLANFHQST